MTESEFTAWAAERGLPSDTTELLLVCAATPEEMRASIDEMRPAPPIYTLADIVEMTDDDRYGISARSNGFVLVGGCPNGDLIGLDVAEEPGTVWYICHEVMHGSPLREVSIRVAVDLNELFDGMEAGDFPYDYFEAKERAARS